MNARALRVEIDEVCITIDASIPRDFHIYSPIFALNNILLAARSVTISALIPSTALVGLI